MWCNLSFLHLCVDAEFLGGAVGEGEDQNLAFLFFVAMGPSGERSQQRRLNNS